MSLRDRTTIETIEDFRIKPRSAIVIKCTCILIE